MGWRSAVGLPEKRIISEIPGIERPGANLLQVYGLGNVALPSVTIDSALTVPAVLSAVSFLTRSLAVVPLHAYRKKPDGPEKIIGGLETLIHEAPNAEWTSFRLRQYFWQQVFTGGRGLMWIERSGANITGLYPINPTKAKITRDAMGQTTYEVDDKKFPAADVIDVPFMLKADGLSHYGPVALGQGAIQLALAMGTYGAKFFAGGGVPPLAMTGPLPAGPDAMKRAMADMQRSIDTAKESDKPLFMIPPGYELKPVGFDPDKGQMTEARRFSVEEIARVWQIPPTFLQDLTHGTMSNTEQEDLRVVKHLLAHWVQALEQEMNLKLFGQRNGGRFVEHNLDGILRGDFLSRMQGLGQAVQNSLLTPDEARALENRAAKGGNADKLFMQGATVPIDTMGAEATPAEGTIDGV